jgi:hypothetical protein
MPASGPPAASPWGDATDLSISEQPTAPWPFVTTTPAHAGFEKAPAPAAPPPGQVDAARDAPSPLWPPIDGRHESTSGVWHATDFGSQNADPASVGSDVVGSDSGSSAGSGSDSAAPVGVAMVGSTPPAWPQESAPPTWPPLPDTGVAGARTSIPEHPMPAPSKQTSAEPMSLSGGAPSVWAAVPTAASGVYVPTSPHMPDTHQWSPVPGSVGPWPSGMPAATPEVQPKSRRFGRVAIIVAIVIAVTLLGSVGIVLGGRHSGSAAGGAPADSGPSAGGPAAGPGVGPGVGSSTSPTASPSPSSSGATDSIPLGDGAALLKRIIPPPPEAHVFNVPDSTNGVMNVEQYTKHYFSSKATEQARLLQEGFQVAASADNQTNDGVEIATHLVQFADSTGAQSYFQDEKSAWSSDHRVTGTFDERSIGGVGFKMSTPDSLGNRRTVMYAYVGNIVAVVNVYTTGQIDETFDGSQLVTQIGVLR